MLPEIKLKQKGFGLSESLVACLILGIAVAGLSTLFSNQIKGMSYLTEGQDLMDLRARLQTVLKRPQNCACHLNPDLTTDDSNDPLLVLDPTNTTSGQTLPLLSVKAGCAVNSPVILQQGGTLTNGLRVQAVQVADLRPTGVAQQWSGFWHMQLVRESDNTPREVRIPLVVNTRLVSPSEAVVDTCQSSVSTAVSSLITCPPGMVMVGPASGIGSYCVDQQPRTAAAFKAAKAVCQNVGNDFGPGILCDHTQWYVACREGVMQSMTSGSIPTTPGELVADFDGVSSGTSYAVTAGSGAASYTTQSCTFIYYTDVNTPRPFRCCLK